MVGFIAAANTIEEEKEEGDRNPNHQGSEFKNLKDSLEDFSFTDSFLDFDSIREFFEDIPVPDTVSFNKIGFGGLQMSMEMGDKGPIVDCGAPGFEESSPIVKRSEPIEGGFGCAVEVREERLEFEKGGDLDCCIEDGMGKVSLVGGPGPVCGDVMVFKSEVLNDELSSAVPDASAAKSEIASAGVDTGTANNLATGSSSVVGTGSSVNNVVKSHEESESVSESASESDSSSTSSSDSSSGSSGSSDDGDEEEEEVKVQLKGELEEGEIEEGEIRDAEKEMIGKIDDDEEEDVDGEKMVDWSDVEFDDIDEEQEEDTVCTRGPVRSKNELKVLPPVPPVDVSLQPHHRMLPVGTVLSIISVQVIVEGVEKHNPLNEGSILWITEKRSPLGFVDEIFGPVQNPYYVVRYNSESEVPAGIRQGTLISFVSEFANHVLGDKNLHKKGYDASGENDEELSDDAEFSDDEKEAEYRRMQKMSKRGISYETVGHKKTDRKKVKNRNGNWKSTTPSGEQKLMGFSQPPSNEVQRNISSIMKSMNNRSSSATGQDFHAVAGFGPPFPPMAPSTGFFQPPKGAWLNGLPSQQPQNVPGGFPGNNISWPSQVQLQLPNQMQFQQQFNPSQGSLPIGILPGGQMNLYGGPSPWPVIIGQNSFNHAAFGMGFQVQPGSPTVNAMNVVDQGMVSNGLHFEQNRNLQPPAIVPENIRALQQFNLGTLKKPYHRGGCRFAGGRGQQRSK